MTMRSRIGAASVLAILVMAILPAVATGAEPTLPDPDGKPADMSKPVQVFILMGQSNMLGFGKISQVKELAPEKYPYLVDDAGEWTVRKDVRNVRVMCSGNNPAKDYLNDWMSAGTGIGNGKTIGPEIGIGYYVGEALDAPVLILKACIGNRSLGWDLLPPGSKPYTVDGKTYAGYRGTGKEPEKTDATMADGWYAGCQYDGDTAACKKVLANLGKYYPGATKYEVRGFCFWQGAKDSGNKGHQEAYEANLVRFIKALRKDFNAPDALFVCATMGHAKKGNKITDAQLAVDGRTGKYPEFKGNVATFYSNPVSKGGGANGHYGGNGETYMNIGVGMGQTMVELLKQNPSKSAEKKAAAPKPEKKPAVTKSKADRLLETAQSAEKMGQKDAAKSIYEMVIKEHPDSEAAKKAAERLKQF